MSNTCSTDSGCIDCSCGSSGIMIGQPAPEFQHVVSYQKGHEDYPRVSLADYRGKWVVLFFYPRDFTFICPTEIRGFAKKMQDFKDLNCEIIAASTDSEWSHKNWYERDLPEVAYPVLADTTQALSRAYGVYNEEDGLAERGLFIIDPEGVLQYMVVSAGSVGRSVNETLRVLKAVQSGELCPVEWEPGADTLGKA